METKYLSTMELIAKVATLSAEHPDATLLVMAPSYYESYDYACSKVCHVGYEPELGFYREWPYYSKEEFLDDCGDDIDAKSVPEFHEYIILYCDN